MTEAEMASFLAAPRTAKLATVRADGRPHVAPIWFDRDDDGSFVFNTGADTVKGRNLLLRRWAALCVDDDRPPFSFVSVEGPVEVSDDLVSVREWAGRLGARYLGEERGEEMAERNGVPGELLVRLHPQRIVSAADMAD
jgi:PPOX class probable F420-dependent enzyme